MSKKKLSEEERIQKQNEEKAFIQESWNRILYKPMSHTLYNGDSKNLKFIQDNSIDLIVTSPPYYNAKEYSQWDTINDYLKDMRRIFKECFIVSSQGRSWLGKPKFKDKKLLLKNLTKLIFAVNSRLNSLQLTIDKIKLLTPQ